jgi:hypothetical protein
MLFNVEQDPDELSNLVDTNPKERGRLAELLDSWEAFQHENAVVGSPSMTAHGSIPPTPGTTLPGAAHEQHD